MVRNLDELHNCPCPSYGNFQVNVEAFLRVRVLLGYPVQSPRPAVARLASEPEPEIRARHAAAMMIGGHSGPGTGGPGRPIGPARPTRSAAQPAPAGGRLTQ
eukprot:763159-Hanusia_phi.AAC.10